VALTPEHLRNHPEFEGAVRLVAKQLIDVASAPPMSRLSVAFANQQRWLMCHVGFALYFRQVRDAQAPGLNITTFSDTVALNGIASRNTADAFLKELVNYGYLVFVDSDEDRRRKPIRPAQQTIDIYTFWIMIHLQALDGFDHKQRAAAFMAHPGCLARIQPLLADILVEKRSFRALGDGFSLLTWLDVGAHLMDFLIQDWTQHPEHADRVVCALAQTSELARKLNISRPHLSRKLREAESMGVLGWTGLPGKSPLWLGPKFRNDYFFGQSVKLAAFAEALDQAS